MSRNSAASQTQATCSDAPRRISRPTSLSQVFHRCHFIFVFVLVVGGWVRKFACDAAGYPPHEGALRHRLAHTAGACAVFPCSTSVGVADLLACHLPPVEKERQEGEFDGADHSTTATRPLEDGHATASLTAIFVEGTWSQARRLEKRIPSHLPRVVLEQPAAAESDSGQGGRVNTVMAVSCFLREIWQQDPLPSPGEQRHVQAGQQREWLREIASFLDGLVAAKEASLAKLHGGKARHPDVPTLSSRDDNGKRRRFRNL